MRWKLTCHVNYDNLREFFGIENGAQNMIQLFKVVDVRYTLIQYYSQMRTRN